MKKLSNHKIKHLKAKVAKFTLYRPKYELCKIRWEFNPFDADTNPHLSIPHGDDISPTYHTLKLNVDNGFIYTARQRKFYGKLTKKELLRLQSDPKFLAIKEEALKYNKKSNCISCLKSKPYAIELECKLLKSKF